jgi:hypothetical protein
MKLKLWMKNVEIGQFYRHWKISRMKVNCHGERSVEKVINKYPYQKNSINSINHYNLRIIDPTSHINNIYLITNR